MRHNDLENDPTWPFCCLVVRRPATSPASRFLLSQRAMPTILARLAPRPRWRALGILFPLTLGAVGLTRPGYAALFSVSGHAPVRAVASHSAFVASAAHRSSARVESVPPIVTTARTAALPRSTPASLGERASLPIRPRAFVDQSTAPVSVTDANPGSNWDRDQCFTVSGGPGVAYECGDLRVARGLPGAVTYEKARAIS